MSEQQLYAGDGTLSAAKLRDVYLRSRLQGTGPGQWLMNDPLFMGGYAEGVET